MPRMPKNKKSELEFFLNDMGRIQYNEQCYRCIYDCKQSFRADIVYCKKYESKRSDAI